MNIVGTDAEMPPDEGFVCTFHFATGERWIVTALTKETMLSRTLTKLAKVPDHAKFIG